MTSLVMCKFYFSLIFIYCNQERLTSLTHHFVVWNFHMGESINVSFTFTCATRPLVFLLRNYNHDRERQEENEKQKRDWFKKQKREQFPLIIIKFRWMPLDILWHLNTHKRLEWSRFEKLSDTTHEFKIAYFRAMRQGLPS